MGNDEFRALVQDELKAWREVDDVAFEPQAADSQRILFYLDGRRLVFTVSGAERNMKQTERQARALIRARAETADEFSA